MIKIRIIALSKLKEKYLAEAVAEYTKRLSAYCELDIIEITPEKLSDKPSLSEIERALECEADLIIKKIPDGAQIISLCVEGKMLSSEEFSQHIEKQAIRGESKLCFLIGSSYGLSPRIKQISSLKLSFSKMTFPHQLARVILLEQIYRSFKISQGGTYHK